MPKNVIADYRARAVPGELNWTLEQDGNEIYLVAIDERGRKARVIAITQPFAGGLTCLYGMDIRDFSGIAEHFDTGEAVIGNYKIYKEAQQRREQQEYESRRNQERKARLSSMTRAEEDELLRRLDMAEAAVRDALKLVESKTK